MSIELIHRMAVPSTAAVIDIGGGASLLADTLVADQFSDLSVLDVSGRALEIVRQRLGADTSVELIHADVLRWFPRRRYDLWHDRAVFHFLVEETAREQYRKTLRRALHPGSTIVVGTFAPDGPDRCSGLPVSRYAPDELVEALGVDLEVLAEEREEHVTPWGATQPFTWLAARFRELSR
jgi:trans-aconitate methyltransferase